MVIEESQETTEGRALLAHLDFRDITVKKEPAERREKRVSEEPPETLDQKVYKVTVCKGRRAQREK